MKINTKYFGEMDCAEEDVLSFPEGLPGFETYQRYLLIRLDNDDDTLLCLQSLEEEQLAFIVVNPFSVVPDYQPRLTDSELALLDCGPDAALAFYSIAVLKDSFRDTTFNLKCPLAVNPLNHLAIQAVMEDDRYSMRHPISSAAPSGSGKEL